MTYSENKCLKYCTNTTDMFLNASRNINEEIIIRKYTMLHFTVNYY